MKILFIALILTILSTVWVYTNEFTNRCIQRSCVEVCQFAKEYEVVLQKPDWFPFGIKRDYIRLFTFEKDLGLEVYE